MGYPLVEEKMKTRYHTVRWGNFHYSLEHFTSYYHVEDALRLIGELSRKGWNCITLTYE